MKRLAPVLMLALVACAPERGDPLRPPGAAPTPARDTRTEAQKLAAEAQARADGAPHIYMVLQPDPSGPLSVVFAIDAGRNNTPQDDPAIRITPEDGKCNPQDLARFNFPDATVRPIFGPDEARAGVTARDLPSFMAMAVTSEMLRSGLVQDVEASKPQNVCTRKLWEQLAVEQSTG